jgi:hypothetical protein
MEISPVFRNDFIIKSKNLKYMKPFKISIFAALLLLCISSCNKDETIPASTDYNMEDLSNHERWRITLYKDEGSDETYHFSDYTFTFNSGDKVIAVKNNDSITGTWHKMTDDGQEKLHLHFGLSLPLHELNEEWYIFEYSGAVIHLGDDCGGDVFYDILIFEKI